MAEINYNTLKSYLNERKEKSKAKGFSPVYLIYGEDLICNTAFDAVLNALIPQAKNSLNFDSIDGSKNHIREAIEKVNTYSLLPGKKVVVIKDTKIFYSKQNETDLITKAKDAFDGDETDKAAKYFLAFLGLSNLSFDDISGENRTKAVKLDLEQMDGGEWIDQLVDFCMQEDLRIPSLGSMDELMQTAIKRGFPKDNHLIITTEVVDKRRKLFKVINHHGVIIDCSIPKGERRADKIAQKAAFDEKLNDILAKFETSIDDDAYEAVIAMTGFDLRTFANNLQKLISYIGDRNSITVDDVHSVLKRTKKDPIFELTNAVSDRDLERSLFFLESLLADGIHPLQILAAMTNQMRKMLLIRGFRESKHGLSWQAGTRYDQFRRKTMPAIRAFDRELQNELMERDRFLAPAVAGDAAGQKHKRPKKPFKTTTDLLVSRQPQNPYPIFQMLLKSEGFTTEELIKLLAVLSQADFRLKSSRQSPRLVLEEVIFRICSRNMS